MVSNYLIHWVDIPALALGELDLRVNVRLRILVSGAIWYSGGTGCARTRGRMTLGNRRW